MSTPYALASPSGGSSHRTTCPTLPTAASYLTTYNPMIGSLVAAVGSLAPLPGSTTYSNPLLTEQIIQMIADTQASIATLTIAVAELTNKVNGSGGGSHATKSTKSMVACPKP
jgi:hypothetical protein